jgi:hypothetical protein
MSLARIRLGSALLPQEGLVLSSPNKSLQRTARHIKCSAAGGRASSSPHRFRARVLTSQPAAAELSR